MANRTGRKIRLRVEEWLAQIPNIDKLPPGFKPPPLTLRSDAQAARGVAVVRRAEKRRVREGSNRG